VSDRIEVGVYGADGKLIATAEANEDGMLPAGLVVPDGGSAYALLPWAPGLHKVMDAQRGACTIERIHTVGGSV
jgi:hypothetical protein